MSRKDTESPAAPGCTWTSTQRPVAGESISIAARVPSRTACSYTDRETGAAASKTSQTTRPASAARGTPRYASARALTYVKRHSRSRA